MLRFRTLSLALLLGLLAAAGCGQTTATKVTYPTKGRAITIINPYAAGGGVDVAIRTLAPSLEKEIEVPIEVQNKPGGGTQIGVTEVAKAKGDGHIVGYNNVMPTLTAYLDPSRQAAFSRVDLQPVAMHTWDSVAFAVKADSPIKSIKDLVDASKANPEKVKVGASGIMSESHVALIQLQQLTSSPYAVVQFDGVAPQLTALMGGHIDVSTGALSNYLPTTKAGQARIIGIMDKEESQFAPGVKTGTAQGYQVEVYFARSFFVPSSTPKEVVEILSAAAKRAMGTDEHKKKMDEMGQKVQYMDPVQSAAYWDNLEGQLKTVMAIVKK